MQETHYTLPNVTLSALEVGEPSSLPSILLLHGWLDNAASFTSLLSLGAKLAPHQHFCALDLAGHGHSTHKANGYYYPFHDYIDDIYQLITTFFPQKCILVGHSLGALISACYSATFPEHVAGLIQIEGIAPLSEAPHLCVTRLREGIIHHQEGRTHHGRGYSHQSAAIRHRSQINNISPELITPLVERGLEQRGERWFWRHDRQLQAQSVYRMPPQQAAAFVEGIQAPHRVILGCDGYSNLPEQAARFVSAGYTILTIAGGHYCHLEHPERVLQTVLEIID